MSIRCILLAQHIGQAGYTFFFLSLSPSNIFPKFLASFRRKAYLCRRKAARGNLKVNFHCARWHNQCSTKVELLKQGGRIWIYLIAKDKKD